MSDVRGTILFCSYGKLTINFVYTKKGFSRGGHYHNFKSDHILLKGKIEFKKLNLDTNVENSSLLCAPCNVSVESKTAHLLTSLSDSLFIEYFNTKYSAINYLPYRKVVTEKIKNMIKYS